MGPYVLVSSATVLCGTGPNCNKLPTIGHPFGPGGKCRPLSRRHQRFHNATNPITPMATRACSKLGRLTPS